jgi:microcystin-dependent protein
MTSTRSFVSSVSIAMVGLATAAAAAQPGRTSPLVGEIRVMAVAAPDTRVVAQLHEQGWIEARGELLSAAEYPELFDAIGRAWTSDGVSEGRFAVPDIKESGRVRSANPFGVMGPGDLVTGGRAAKPRLNQALISYWIYAGRAPAFR